jgi:ABC-2 type transport system permease protein
MFNSEYNSNTMKLILTRPTSRFSIFTGKFLALLTILAINIGCVMVLSLVIGIIFNFDSVTFIGIVRSMIAYVVSLLPLVTFTLFVVILANLVKSGNSVFFLTVLSFIFMYVLGIIFHQASSFLFTSMFDWYRLWISEAIQWFKLLRMSLIMIGFSIMLYCIGYLLFERKVV